MASSDNPPELWVTLTQIGEATAVSLLHPDPTPWLASGSLSTLSDILAVKVDTREGGDYNLSNLLVTLEAVMGRTSGENLVNRIRELRARKRMTQAALANRVCVSRQTISAIENGEYNPSVVLALRIAQLFDESVEAIFWIDEPV